jgi:hypothetical protein
MEEMISKIITQHIKPDRKEKSNAKLNAAIASYVYDREYRKRCLEWLQKKIEYADNFLKEAEPGKRAGEEEVKSNITDNENAVIKGSHGYIQGYNGSAVTDSANQVTVAAEAYGSGSENGHSPGMPGKLNGAMQEMSGEREPLKNAVMEGDTGFFSGNNLREAETLGMEVIIPDQQFRKRDAHFEGRRGHGGRGGSRQKILNMIKRKTDTSVLQKNRWNIQGM